ncbi:hypothetical protein [Streptomyces venezuelae]
MGAALARELAARHARIALLGLERAALEQLAATLPTPALARARFRRRPPQRPIAQTGPLGAGGRAAHRPH